MALRRAGLSVPNYCIAIRQLERPVQRLFAKYFIALILLVDACIFGQVLVGIWSFFSSTWVSEKMAFLGQGDVREFVYYIAVPLLAIAVLSAAMTKGLLAALSWQITRYHATAELVSSLCEILNGIPDRSATWAQDGKRVLISAIEDGARLIEVSMWRRLPSRDANTDLWVRTRALRRAAAFRELKFWVHSPRAETRETIIQRLGETLEHVLSGEWHYLAESDPLPLNVRAIWQRIGSILTTVFWAAVPLVVVLLLRQALPAQKEIWDKFLIPAFLLGALYGLLTADPTAGERLGTVASLFKSFRSGSDK